MPSTFWPPQVTCSAIVANPSVTVLTVPATSTSTPSSSSGTTTGLVNLQPSSTTSPPSAQPSTARAASAIVNIPWAITPGSPTEVATRSDQWIGLKSPLAPA